MSIADWLEVARSWVAAFDAPDVRSVHLVHKGFTAHRLWDAFLEQFAREPQDILLHRQYAREIAKERASCPLPLSALMISPSNFYQSPLLNQQRKALCVKNDVVNMKELYKKNGQKTWKNEISPIIREQKKMYITQSSTPGVSAYQDLYDKFRQKIMKAIRNEATQYNNTEKCPLKIEGRMEAFFEASKEQLESLGFSCLQKRKNYVLFSKNLSEKLDLCWSIESTEYFLTNGPEAMLVPFFHLRKASFKGKISRAPAEAYLEIPYQQLVDGFSNVYMTCRAINEIKLVTRAHLTLAEYMIPWVVDAVKKLDNPPRS